MPVTRSNTDTEDDHKCIIEEVLNLVHGEDQPMTQALLGLGMETVGHWLSLDFKDCESLTYTTQNSQGNDVSKTIPKSHARMLQALKQCTMHLHSQGNPIDLDDIQGGIISDDFDKFCFSPHNNPNVSFTTSSGSSLGGNPTGKLSNTGSSNDFFISEKQNEVCEIQKSIHRDILVFTEVEDVLDETFVLSSSNPEATDLFLKTQNL